MIGGEEVHQHLLLISRGILLHRVHEFIECLPAAPLNIILQPPIYNDLFLVKVDSVALLHMRGDPYKFLILDHSSSHLLPRGLHGRSYSYTT